MATGEVPEVPATSCNSMETAIKSLTQVVQNLQQQQSTFNKSLLELSGKVAQPSVQLSGDTQQALVVEVAFVVFCMLLCIYVLFLYN